MSIIAITWATEVTPPSFLLFLPRSSLSVGTVIVNSRTTTDEPTHGATDTVNTALQANVSFATRSRQARTAPFPLILTLPMTPRNGIGTTDLTSKTRTINVAKSTPPSTLGTPYVPMTAPTTQSILIALFVVLTPVPVDLSMVPIPIARVPATLLPVRIPMLLSLP